MRGMGGHLETESFSKKSSDCHAFHSNESIDRFYFTANVVLGF